MFSGPVAAVLAIVGYVALWFAVAYGTVRVWRLLRARRRYRRLVESAVAFSGIVWLPTLRAHITVIWTLDPSETCLAASVMLPDTDEIAALVLAGADPVDLHRRFLADVQVLVESVIVDGAMPDDFRLIQVPRL